MLAITSFTVTYAQIGGGTNSVKVSLNTWVPVVDASDVFSFTMSFDLKYPYLDADSFTVGVYWSYVNYFGKDGFDNLGIISLAGLFRFYPIEKFFLGDDVCYGFYTDREESGGF